MDTFTDMYAPIIGRVLVGGFFLWGGIERSLNFNSIVQLLASSHLPAAAALATLVIAIGVLGGIALVIGYHTSLTALILAIFTILTTLLFAHFDSEVGASLFLENMAIVGGLFYISAFGSGAWDPAFRYRRKQQ